MAKLKQSTGNQRIRNLVTFSVLIMLTFCVVVFYQGSRGYSQALKDGEIKSERLTHILSDHVTQTLLGADLSIRRAIERQYINALFGNNLVEYTEQNFRLWLNETPQVVTMALINEKGEVEVAASKPGYEQWLEYSHVMLGNALFEHMKDADDRYLFIGKHITKQAPPLIVLSRRYNKLNGEFGGVVVAGVNPQYFLDFYKSVAPGNYKYMSINLDDGTQLVSGPDNDPIVTDKITSSFANQTDATKNEEPVTTVERLGDNKNIKIISKRGLKLMPVVVTTVTGEDDIFATWRETRAKDIGFLVLFTVFGSVLSFFAIAMARQIVRAEESESAAILASQAKSEFLANMSHELRTPLNAIIGFSEMINSGYFGPLNPKQKERLHDINLCGTHLLQLINDILEYSKGDAGKLELVEEKVDVPEIINECERIMSGKTKMKNIQMTVNIEPGMPSLWGDKRKIRQMLLNLLSNAVKFTLDKGAVKVLAKVEATGAITIMISDTGVGIAEDDIPKALSVFGQVHRNQSHEGTGLGLPLCKMYAELHGGKLLLASKLGEGTTVKIIFPHQRTLGQVKK